MTVRPQGGNPPPRVFRLPGDHIVNRMGFPNAGRRRGRREPGAGCRPPPVPLGISLGKFKATPRRRPGRGRRDRARRSRALLQRTPAYYVVNVTSPNTPGLRALQEVGRLAALLDAVPLRSTSQPGWRRRAAAPLLVKVAPELDDGRPGGWSSACVLRYDTGGLVAHQHARRGVAGRAAVSGPDLSALRSAMVRAAAAHAARRPGHRGAGGVDSGRRRLPEVLAGARPGRALHRPGVPGPGCCVRAVARPLAARHRPALDGADRARPTGAPPTHRAPVTAARPERRSASGSTPPSRPAGPLCVGIDPHPALLAAWGLPDDAGGLERFALTVVEALADRVAVAQAAGGVLRAARLGRGRRARAGARRARPRRAR